MMTIYGEMMQVIEKEVAVSCTVGEKASIWLADKPHVVVVPFEWAHQYSDDTSITVQEKVALMVRDPTPPAGQPAIEATRHLADKVFKAVEGHFGLTQPVRAYSRMLFHPNNEDSCVSMRFDLVTAYLRSAKEQQALQDKRAATKSE